MIPHIDKSRIINKQMGNSEESPIEPTPRHVEKQKKEAFHFDTSCPDECLLFFQQKWLNYCANGPKTGGKLGSGWVKKGRHGRTMAHLCARLFSANAALARTSAGRVVETRRRPATLFHLPPVTYPLAPSFFFLPLPPSSGFFCCLS